MSASIEQIPPELTWKVRQVAMYPGREIDAVKLPDDDDGVHFGLFCDNELCSVISLFVKDNTARFRKFATIPSKQNQGFGKQLLSYLIDFCKQEKVALLWCSARVSALGFYKKFGFEESGDIYKTGEIDYIRLTLNLIVL